MLFHDNCSQYLRRFFYGIELKGKSVLDVGCGNGWISFYASDNGAEVVGLEPRVGEYSRKSQILLGKGSVTILPTLIQFYDSIKKFDLIILHDSINHLDETACIELKDNKEAQERYYVIFTKLWDMLNVGGKILIADASRRNFFADLGLTNPFDRTIEWHKHQTPELWYRLLRDCGFIHPNINWLTPRKLLFLDRILSNKIASYFLVSHFRLVMEKS